jgi:ribosomal protein L34E
MPGESVRLDGKEVQEMSVKKKTVIQNCSKCGESFGIAWVSAREFRQYWTTEKRERFRFTCAKCCDFKKSPLPLNADGKENGKGKVV